MSQDRGQPLSARQRHGQGTNFHQDHTRKDRVLAALAASGTPLTTKELARLTGDFFATTRTSNTLHTLLKEGRVTRALRHERLGKVTSVKVAYWSAVVPEAGGSGI